MSTTGSTSAQRRLHFRRDNPPALRLTDDDLAVLRHDAAKHRFLRSTQIVRLLARPPKKIVERLGALYHTGYLDRPRAQLEYYATAGSSPMVYGLGNRGASALARFREVAAPKVDRTDKNRDAGRLFVEHTLMVAEIMIGFELAAGARSDVLLMEPQEVLARPPETTQRAPNPWKWQINVSIGCQTHGIAQVPDKMIGLHLTRVRKRIYFVLEADRATMPVLRNNLKQTSVQRKLRTYYHAYRTGVHKDQYGIANFRDLTVTTSPQRTAAMLQAAKELTGGSGSNLFLFADASALAAASDVMTFNWTSGNGESVRLIEYPAPIDRNILRDLERNKLHGAHYPVSFDGAAVLAAVKAKAIGGRERRPALTASAPCSARCRRRGRRRSSARPREYGQRSAGVHPWRSFPSTASTPSPGQTQSKSVTHVSGTKRHLCLRTHKMALRRGRY